MAPFIVSHTSLLYPKKNELHITPQQHAPVVRQPPRDRLLFVAGWHCDVAAEQQRGLLHDVEGQRAHEAARHLDAEFVANVVDVEVKLERCGPVRAELWAPAYANNTKHGQQGGRDAMGEVCRSEQQRQQRPFKGCS